MTAWLFLLIVALVLLGRAGDVSPLSLRGLTSPARQPSACADWFNPRCIEQTTSRHRGAIQRTTEEHPECIQRTTKAHPTSASMRDNPGLLVTVIDNDDSAGASKQKQFPVSTTRKRKAASNNNV